MLSRVLESPTVTPINQHAWLKFYTGFQKRNSRNLGMDRITFLFVTLFDFQIASAEASTNIQPKITYISIVGPSIEESLLQVIG